MKVLQEAYELLNQIYINKGTTSYVDTFQFTEAAKQASRGYFDERLKSYQKTQEETDDLRPFLSDHLPLLLSSSGYVLYPPDYHRMVLLTSGSKSREVDIVDQGSWPGRVDSELLPVDIEHPIAVLYSKGIQFTPSNTPSPKITYFRLPVDPVISVTYDSETGREVIDWENSTDLEWKGDSVNEITRRILEYMGVSMKDPEVLQFSQIKKEEYK